MQLIESGIIDNILSYFKPKERFENDEPTQLTLDHLLIWFQLWMGLLSIAVTSFFFEFLMTKIGKIAMRKAMAVLRLLWESLD
jgi:hypothetical protein